MPGLIAIAVAAAVGLALGLVGVLLGWDAEPPPGGES